MKKLITVLALAALLSACGNAEKSTTSETTQPQTTTTTEATATESAKYTTYSGEGFSFSYPEDWKAFDTSQLNSPAIKAAFSDPAATKFADNINFTIEANASGVADPEQLAATLVDYYVNNGINAGIEGYQKTSYTDKPYKDFKGGVLQGTYKNAAGVDVVMVQYMIPVNAELYTATLTYGKDSYDDAGKKEVEDILNSVTISPATAQTTGTNASDTAGSDAVAFETAADFFNEITPIITEQTAFMEQPSYDFFAQNSELFIPETPDVQNKVKKLVDPAVTPKHLNKNIANYFESFIQISGEVVSVEENNSLGATFSVVHIMDDNENNIVAVYPNSTGELLEGDYATVIGPPIANFSFANISGGYTNATLIGAALLEQE